MSQPADIIFEDDPGTDENELADPQAENNFGVHPPDDLSQFQGLHIVEDFKQYELATGGSRALAFLIDGVVVAALQKAVQAGGTTLLGQGHVMIAGSAAILVGYMYFTFTQFNNGQTMGKKVMKIKTVPDAGGELLGFGQILGRETLGRLLSGLPLAMGYVGAWRSEDKKCWHDRLFKTHVVKVG